MYAHLEWENFNIDPSIVTVYFKSGFGGTLGCFGSNLFYQMSKAAQRQVRDMYKRRKCFGLRSENKVSSVQNNNHSGRSSEKGMKGLNKHFWCKSLLIGSKYIDKFL